MYIKTEGTAQVRHFKTGEVIKIESDELDWEVVSSHERGMGTDRFWQAETSRDELGNLRWEISEYPVGAIGLIATDLNGHELDKDFSFSIEHESDASDDDIDNPDVFDRSSAAEKMKQWFHRNYEDPANSFLTKPKWVDISGFMVGQRHRLKPLKMNSAMTFHSNLLKK